MVRWHFAWGMLAVFVLVSLSGCGRVDVVPPPEESLRSEVRKQAVAPPSTEPVEVSPEAVGKSQEILVQETATPALTEEDIERMDGRIRSRFALNDSSRFQIATMRDGQKLIVAKVKEQGDRYVFSVAANKGRSVFSSRTVEKSKCESLVPESNEALRWIAISKARPPTNARDATYHRRVVDLVFQSFANSFPQSEHLVRVDRIRTLWEEEIGKLESGLWKAGNKWYEQGEKPDAKLPANTQKLLMYIRDSLSKGYRFRAASYCEQVQIPAGFNAEREEFQRIVALINAGLANDLEAELAKIDRKKTLVKNKCDRRLEEIASWKPPRMSFVKTIKESRSHYELRKAQARRKAASDLQRKQEAARQQAKEKYGLLMKKCDHDSAAMRKKFGDCRDMLAQLKL